MKLSIALFVRVGPPVAHVRVSPCGRRAGDAERQYALPTGPWRAGAGMPRISKPPLARAIDAAGEPRMAASKDEVRQTRALQPGGLRNVDVGCFQIKLQNIPRAPHRPRAGIRSGGQCALCRALPDISARTAGKLGSGSRCQSFLEFPAWHSLSPGRVLQVERACIGRRAPAGAYQVGPWTINADQPSKAAAVGMVRAMQLRGVRVIDVGCFQVDLFYHPYAFRP